jgi:2-dehydropantoate 2-reductase
MTRIAILGAGAIGSTILAWLAQNPEHDILACTRTPFTSLSLETPDRSLHVSPRVLTDPETAAPVVDWLLVSTKTYDAPGAARWFPRLVGPQTRVAILQNGVEHLERFSKYLPAAQLLPVIVDIPAERSAPGRVRQRAFGRMTVANSPAGQAYADLFSHTPIERIITDDFRTAAWKKLCLNVPGAVSAIALKPAVIAHDEAIADVMRGLIREAVLVGRAEGAALEDGIVDEVVNGYRGAPPDSMNSLHADRAAGRPMEVDARNGIIVRLGRKHHIPTPFNQMAVALLGAVAAG